MTTINDLITDPDLNALMNELGMGDVEVKPMSRRRGVPQTWRAEDGYIIGYDPHKDSQGKYGVALYRPIDGKRGNKKRTATQWERIYFRGFAKRKTARTRALKLYAKHSPKWAARNAWWLETK